MPCSKQAQNSRYFFTLNIICAVFGKNKPTLMLDLNANKYLNMLLVFSVVINTVSLPHSANKSDVLWSTGED
jgi:hypothetical protein